MDQTNPDFRAPVYILGGRIKRDPLAVVTRELNKIEKPEVQRNQEIVKEIDSLHEPTTRETLLAFCAECWVEWPCATHRAIYGENKDNCVHRI